MEPKRGIIIKSTDNRYCVVVQRFYPGVRDFSCREEQFLNEDIKEGLKLFIHGKQNGTNFPPHPELYEMGNTFTYKFGFPKGGMESVNGGDGMSCAIREVKQETGINIDKNLLSRSHAIILLGKLQSIYYILENYRIDRTINTPREFKYEIAQVLWLTLDEIKNLPRKNCSYGFREAVKSLTARERSPPPPTFNGPSPLTPINMDRNLFLDFTKAVLECYQKRTRTSTYKGGGKSSRSSRSKSKIEELADILILNTSLIRIADNIEEETMEKKDLEEQFTKMCIKRKTMKKKKQGNKSKKQGKKSKKQGKI